ncbi:helix-turn-helix domain-containing protein [Streptomyces sp. NPDC059639]|uniref:helix-turn-helix domain-containing protein n=1 Tax=Streptomyces sp. NPDC059639 TaxID=3346891 RepID=UPI0036AAD5BD
MTSDQPSLFDDDENGGAGDVPSPSHNTSGGGGNGGSGGSRDASAAGYVGIWADWGDFGKYGANGMKGGAALVLELNRIVYQSGIASPIGSKRGQGARLRYLNSEAGRAELRAQGVSDRAMRDWFRGKSRPSKANLERLDAAYWMRRRANLVRSGWLKRHLDNSGQGRQIEVYPVDQSGVTPGRERPTVNERSVSVRHLWADIVDAWADQDDAALDELWDDIICDLDSDYTAYAYVSAVGISA